MSNAISRRDFVNGVSVAFGTALFAACDPRCTRQSGQQALGLATQNAGRDSAFADAHALRDGKEFSLSGLPVEADVDLVIVGAGISGLTAAYRYRQKHAHARILILDNTDDFGGHARRCEMQVGGQVILGYGGSESLQSPATLWSAESLHVLDELGVNLNHLAESFDRELYPNLGLSRGVLFTKEAFGRDALVVGDPTRMIADDIAPHRLNAKDPREFVAEFPLSEGQRQALSELYADARDVLAGIPAGERLQALAAISYREFLQKYWQLDDVAANVFQKRSHDYFAIGIDGIAALDAAEAGYPGFAALGLPDRDEVLAKLNDPYIHHFPDGNASIARMLVRKLIPEIAPGSTMADVVLAKFAYERLDVPRAGVRIRLRSTVVHISDPFNKQVEVGYVSDGQVHKVRARQVIHAGYSGMVAYMLPTLQSSKKEALRACVKAPILYAKVAVRNWKPWVNVGVHEVTNPMGFFSRIKLDYPVSLGAYRFSSSPNEPIGLHMVHVPTPGGTGLDQRGAWRAGRAALLALSSAEIELKVVDELTRILGPGGFDARRDIAAIAIYRWGHGYAYAFNSLYDRPQVPDLASIARAQVGSLAIANSDAAWSAYLNAAMDEGSRAAQELC
jgi:spermidine dehydrogenase